MDKGSETRLFLQQTEHEQALALVELAVDLKEKSEATANQANALREAALRAHCSSLSLSQSSRQLVLLAKSLITNLKNPPMINDPSFEENRKRLAALLDQLLEENPETKNQTENSEPEKILDFSQRLRKLEDVCLGRPMIPSFSNHSRLRAKTPCGMDDRYPSDSPRENIFNDLVIELPTVQEHGLVNFTSKRPHSSPNYSFKSLRKVKMSLLKLEEDINE